MMMEPPTGSPSSDRDSAGHQEDQDQGIGKEAQKTDQGSEARLPGQAVRAINAQPPHCLGGSQSGWSCFEQGEQVPQGHIPEAVQCGVRFIQMKPPVDSVCRLGSIPRA